MTCQDPLSEPVNLPRVPGRILAGTLLALAVAAGVASAAQWAADPRRLLFSYLVGYLFVASLGVGSLAWVMLHHLSGAVWSVSLRRLMENLTKPLTWIALLFIPIALNLGKLFPWAQSAGTAGPTLSAHQAIWLTRDFFTLRALVYFGVWIVVAALLSRGSGLQDEQAGASSILTGRLRATSAWGMVLLGLTTSCAAFDWIMSLDAHWFSTMFGVYFWIGSLLGSLAALTLLVLAFRATGWLRSSITTEHLHDLGKLLFSFVVFWAYIAFSQYFLIWYANFPEETRWYAARRVGSWNTVSWALLFGHFVIPFAILLFRAARRSAFWLAFAAIWILGFHYLDLYWQVMPVLYPEGAQPRWLDGSLLMMLVLSSGAMVALACQARPLVPVGDPDLAESLAFRTS